MTSSLTATNEFLARDVAVRQIADRIASRDSYLVTIPPGSLRSVAGNLDALSAWTAYVDNGTHFVLHTSRSGALQAADLLAPVAAVLVVPKTVPASDLSRVVAHPMPEDGSQDLLVLHEDDGPIFWPLLFIDAIDLLDPVLASQLRANQVTAPAPC